MLCNGWLPKPKGDIMTYEEQKILDTLPEGGLNPRTYKSIAWSTNIKEREVRAIVAHLVTDHHICICTTSSGGYFLATTYEEYNEAHRELISRIKKLSKRAKGLRLGYNENVRRDEQLTLI